MLGIHKLRTRWRLAIISAAGVLLAMVAAIIAFNAFQSWQLLRESTASLEEAIGWEDGDAPLATRTVELLPLTTDGQLLSIKREKGHKKSKEKGGDSLDSHTKYGYTELEKELGIWCNSNATLDTIQLVGLEHGTCYVKFVGAETIDGTSILVVAYVDVSAQLELIRMVNLIFVLITIVACAVAAWLGWHAGKGVEEASEAQKRLYENMSHELKTPLAAISGYVEGAIMGVVPQQHANEAILRESERMTREIEQLLDLSRLEAGMISPKFEKVELGELVQDCLMPFEGTARTRELEIRLELTEGCVRADPDLLTHALENLFSNAMRHAAQLVRIGYDGKTLTVENDGNIPAQSELDGLFDRFYTDAHGGSGIGLALTREIVALHGWKIEAARTTDTLVVTIAFAEQ